MAAGDIPKAVWDGNTLEFGFPLDQPVAYPQSRPGSERVVSPAGVSDSWIVGTDQLLAGTARWIPAATGTTPDGTPITGWDAAAGWDAFLTYARAMNTFTFHPDRGGAGVTCYLVEPMDGPPDVEVDGTKRVRIVIRTADGSKFTGY